MDPLRGTLDPLGRSVEPLGTSLNTIEYKITEKPARPPLLYRSWIGLQEMEPERSHLEEPFIATEKPIPCRRIPIQHEHATYHFSPFHPFTGTWMSTGRGNPLSRAQGKRSASRYALSTCSDAAPGYGRPR